MKFSYSKVAIAICFTTNNHNKCIRVEILHCVHARARVCVHVCVYVCVCTHVCMHVHTSALSSGAIGDS